MIIVISKCKNVRKPEKLTIELGITIKRVKQKKSH